MSEPIDLSKYSLEVGTGPSYLDWRLLFDERQRKEIALAELYAEHFAHGTTGHNQLLIIAKLAAMLNKLNAGLKEHKG